MAINQITNNSVNTSTQSSVKQTNDVVDKSKSGRKEGEGDQGSPYSDKVSISGKASQLERLSQELFTDLKPDTQIGDVAHKLYEFGFITLEDLNHIPLATRTQKINSPDQAVSVLQTQSRDLALQGEDSATLEGVNRMLTTLKNMTAPSYPASAYQRVTGYGYVGIQ
ncbi:hypothetical protein [Litoribacillus peritrichatus]|uniref:Uncharacterized protein n=1 Tax=Litoribacillus peritrichatus TaxID=718191 RepID=A0ABP7M1U3_9GAMM